VIHTINDISTESGLSVATISRYLNGKTIRERNKKTVEEAILKLDYIVNKNARGLRLSESRMIGLLFPKLDDIFSSIMISITQRLLDEKNYTVILATSGLGAKEKNAVDFLVAHRVEGIIAIPIYPSLNSYESAKKRKIPIVFYDVDMAENGSDSIVADNFNIGRLSANTFAEKAHKKVAIICGTEDAYTAKQRKEGFLKGLEDNNIALNNEYIVENASDAEYGGYIGTKKLLAMQEPPTAIFASNYYFTIGMITALNEMKLIPGKDISVIGVDNLSLTKIIRPKLTMVTQPYEKIAAAAVDLLIKRIGEKDGYYNSRRITLEASIETGESVADLR